MIAAKIINPISINRLAGRGWIAGRTGALVDGSTSFLSAQIQINDVKTGANMANFMSDNNGDYEFIGLNPHREFVITSIDVDNIEPLFDPVARVFKPANA